MNWSKNVLTEADYVKATISFLIIGSVTVVFAIGCAILMIFEPESGRDEEAGVVGLLSLVGMFLT